MSWVVNPNAILICKATLRSSSPMCLLVLVAGEGKGVNVWGSGTQNKMKEGQRMAKGNKLEK